MSEKLPENMRIVTLRTVKIWKTTKKYPSEDYKTSIEHVKSLQDHLQTERIELIQQAVMRITGKNIKDIQTVSFQGHEFGLIIIFSVRNGFRSSPKSNYK